MTCPFPTIAEIQAAVCDEFGLSRVEMLGDRRSANLARPRQVAMWLAVRLTPNSLPVIASHFRRDHTTISFAVKRVDQRIFEVDNYGRAALALYARFTEDARQMELGGV